MNIAILGAGGLGKAAAQIIEHKKEMTLVALADAGGFVYNQSGIGADDVLRVKIGGSVSQMENGIETSDAIGETIALGHKIDAVRPGLEALAAGLQEPGERVQLRLVPLDRSTRSACRTQRGDHPS